MYIPEDFAVNDFNTVQTFIKQFPFATLVSAGGNFPVATHLPFIFDTEINHGFTENNFKLLSHIASVNPHVEVLNENENVLLIFQGPHGYISPQLYENQKSVPTWNYTAIHAYGKLKFIESTEDSYHFLQKLINYFEPGFTLKFQNLPQKYIDTLMSEIKVFEVQINKTESCFKLSQNKPEKDRFNIIAHLKKSENDSDKMLGDFWGKFLKYEG